MPPLALASMFSAVAWMWVAVKVKVKVKPLPMFGFSIAELISGLRGPSMRVARQYPMVEVVNGKLYVIGVCENEISAEIYDPDVGSWDSVAVAVEPFIERRIPTPMCGSVVNGRKIYAMATFGVVAYDVETGVWEYIFNSSGTLSCCILNGVLYWCNAKQIKGLDLEKGHQKANTGIGLEGEWQLGTGNAQVVKFEGKLVVVWQKTEIDKGCVYEIRCWEIDVKKGKNGELQGNVCFNDSVFSLPEDSVLINCLAVAF